MLFLNHAHNARKMVVGREFVYVLNEDSLSLFRILPLGQSMKIGDRTLTPPLAFEYQYGRNDIEGLDLAGVADFMEVNHQLVFAQGTKFLLYEHIRRNADEGVPGLLPASDDNGEDTPEVTYKLRFLGETDL